MVLVAEDISVRPFHDAATRVYGSPEIYWKHSGVLADWASSSQFTKCATSLTLFSLQRVSRKHSVGFWLNFCFLVQFKF